MSPATPNLSTWPLPMGDKSLTMPSPTPTTPWTTPTCTAPAVGAGGMAGHQAQAAGSRCTCRVLPLDYVPRAQVARDTRGFIKLVADADTNQLVGITAVTTDAGDLAAAGGYILAANMTVTQLATQWSPYLTMAEGLKIAAQSFTTDVSMLSC